MTSSAATARDSTPPVSVDEEAAGAHDEAAAVRFLVELGHALHRRGLAAHRLEDAMTGISRRLGQDAAFFSTPTMLMIRFGPPEEQRTTLLRVSPAAGAELGKLADLDRVAEGVARGLIGLEEGLRALAVIEAAPEPYGPWATVVSSGLLSMAACVFFEGHPAEIGASGAIGASVGALDAHLFSRWPTAERMRDLLSALLAAFTAAALAGQARPPLVFLAGIIALVPGLALTTALSELATRNLVSGTARLTGAGLTFLQLAMGLALAARATPSVWTAAPLPGPGTPAWAQLPALLAAGLAVQVLFRARPRHLPWVFLSVVAALAGSRLGSVVLGPDLGALVGALGVGLVGNAGARWLHRPAVIGILPGLLLLVPGSLGMRSLSSLIQDDALTGVRAAFSMVMTASAIVFGLFLSNLVVSPRRPL